MFVLLDDYVRHRGGENRLRALVAVAEELGVAGPTIRVVAGRLRDEASACRYCRGPPLIVRTPPIV